MAKETNQPSTIQFDEKRKKALLEHINATPVSRRLNAFRIAEKDPKLTENEKDFWASTLKIERAKKK